MSFSTLSFQLLDFMLFFNKGFVLFEELVEQHRVDLFVTDSVHFALLCGPPGSDSPRPLPRRSGQMRRLVAVACVPEADRLEREERFAGLIHRLNVVFIPARRDVTAAESSAHGYCHRVRDSSPTNWAECWCELMLPIKQWLLTIRTVHVGLPMTNTLSAVVTLPPALTPNAVLLLPVVLSASAHTSIRRIAIAGGVAMKRLNTDGGVSVPVVLLMSA